MNLLLFLVIICAHGVLVNSDEDIRDYSFPKFLKFFFKLFFYIPSNVTSQDVTFYLFTKSISDGKLLSDNSTIDVTKTTKVLVHGFTGNHNRSWYHRLTDELLKKGDFNVVQVDWRRISNSVYFSAALNTKPVAKYLAAFILKRNLDPKKLHFIGHSLGAHISSMAANIITNSTGVRPARISGLDPAGRFYGTFLANKDDRLDSEDADVVDVFHTDGGGFGYYRPSGTFDVYIDGGTRIQPECFKFWAHTTNLGDLFEDFFCSHTRSFVWFTEIINNYKYSCRKCESWTRSVLGLCRNHDKYVFGAEDIDESFKGVCFVRTRDKIVV